MPEFFEVLPPQQAYHKLESSYTPRLKTEEIPTAEALDRVLAVDILSPEDLPAFPRSTMDGYAVRAEDVYGASEGLPAYLEVVGEVIMGAEPAFALRSGQAALIFTGGMLPRGANAVVMVENTQVLGEGVEVLRPVAVGENVIQVGEDIRQGTAVLARGHSLQPQDIGGLMALGIISVPVYRKPRVAIISTGDEVVSPGQKPPAGKVRDINTYTCAALTARAGGIPLLMGIIPDDRAALEDACRQGMEQADIVIISAGSSVSTRDLTAQVINSLGKPGILVHGVAIRPGKPTVLGVVENVPIFGLPGNPVSAVVLFTLFVAPTIRRLSGAPAASSGRTLTARLTHSIASVAGREDYVPVRLLEKQGELLAEPIFGKSNLIFTLVRAEGTVCVPLDQGGISAGDMVEVLIF